MNFRVNNNGNNHQEMTVYTTTETLDEKEAIRLAQKMVSAAEELLWGVDMKLYSCACGNIAEDLKEYL